MARQRFIKPGFFLHGELYDAEAASGLPLRVAFAGLWTQADRRGVFRCKPRELKSAVLPYDPVDMADVIAALESAGFIRTYEVDGKTYGFIPTLTDHQSFHKDEKPSADPGPESAPLRHCAGTVPAPCNSELVATDGLGSQHHFSTVPAPCQHADPTTTLLRPYPTAAGGAAATPCSVPPELTNELHRSAYEHFWQRAKNKQAFAAEVRANAIGMPGHTSGKPYGWATMGRALHDLMVDGGDCTALRLRIFADKVRDLPEFQEETEMVSDGMKSVLCRAVDGWWVSVATGERISEVVA